jgi:hypothetical protein
MLLQTWHLGERTELGYRLSQTKSGMTIPVWAQARFYQNLQRELPICSPDGPLRNALRAKHFDGSRI